MNCFDKCHKALRDEMDKEFTKLFRDIDMEKARQPSKKVLPDKTIWVRFRPKGVRK